MSWLLILGWLLVLWGLWLVQRTFRSLLRRRALLRNPVRVSGKIIKLEDTATEGDLVPTQAPVVRYRAQDAQFYELRLLPRMVDEGSRAGSAMTVFYERGNPGNAVHALRMWDVNLACALSLIPVLAGAGLILTSHQDASAAAPATPAASANKSHH